MFKVEIGFKCLDVEVRHAVLLFQCTRGAPAVKCWDVQCPMSNVSVKVPTDQMTRWVSGSLGCLTGTLDMGHWTSQHLTAGEGKHVNAVTAPSISPASGPSQRSSRSPAPAAV